jgi:hypothetical protein
VFVVLSAYSRGPRLGNSNIPNFQTELNYFPSRTGKAVSVLKHNSWRREDASNAARTLHLGTMLSFALRVFYPGENVCTEGYVGPIADVSSMRKTPSPVRTRTLVA